MTSSKQDLWTLFPMTALLGFAGWVALMVETSDVAAAIVFVALFLGAAWRVCRSYQRLCREAATRERLARPDDWMSA